MTGSLLLGGKALRQGMDGCAEALFVDSVQGFIDGNKAVDTLDERNGQMPGIVAHEAHVAYGNGGISLFWTGNGDKRRVLVVVVVTAEQETGSVCPGSLETGAVHPLGGTGFAQSGQEEAEFEEFQKPHDTVVEQIHITACILFHKMIQIIGRFVLHDI